MDADILALVHNQHAFRPTAGQTSQKSYVIRMQRIHNLWTQYVVLT